MMARISVEMVENVSKFGTFSLLFLLALSIVDYAVKTPVLDRNDVAVLAIRDKAARISNDRMRELARDPVSQLAFGGALSDCGWGGSLFVSRETRVECAAIGFTDLRERWAYAYHHASLDRHAPAAAPSGEASPREVEPLPADAPIIDRLLRIAGVE